MTSDADAIRAWADYHPAGVLMRGRRVFGSINGDGYVITRFQGRVYQMHRLIWLHQHGKWPEHQIDHINGVRDDNRIENLRDVPSAVNTQNMRGALKTNKLGWLGVCAHKNRFVSQISVGRKKVHLGSFATAEEAHAAYVAAKRKYHEGCTL